VDADLASKYIVKIAHSQKYDELEKQAQEILDVMEKEGCVPILMEHSNPFREDTTIVFLFKKEAS